MAIPSYANSTIQTSGATPDTFESWVNKTNTLFNDVATVVVTTEASSGGATTSGNGHIEGILSANTIAVGTSLRGGTITTPATLNIKSSVAMTPSTSSTFVINAATSTTLSGDVTVNGGTKTFAVSTPVTNVSSANFNITSTALNVAAGTTSTFAGTTTLSGTANLTGTSNITNGVIATASVTDLTATGTIHFNNTTGVELSTGTTAQRPGTPATGTLRYNTTLNVFEGSDNNSNWTRLNGATVSSSEPTNSQGALWVDTTAGAMKVRNGSVWTQVHSITSDANKAYLTKDFDMTGDLDVTGTIYATGDITALSDERVKENVMTVENALSKVCEMRGVYYNKIGEAERKVGVIAQEVERIVPELVIENASGYKSVAYTNALGLIIEAIKELKDEIESLKKG